jgi:hypothetical protein
MAVSLAWLLTGCKFDAAGLGTDTAAGSESTGTGTGDSSSGEPTTGGSTTAVGTDTGDLDTGSSGDPCAAGCAPAVGWTNVDAAAGHALVLDAMDDAVVVGDRVQDGDGELRDAWVAKFAGATGERAWENWHDGMSRRTDFARAVVILPNGQILIAGMSQEDPDRRQDVWLGWYAPEDGAELTSSNLGTAHWNGDDVELDESARALAVDPAGDLLVGGTRCYIPCEVPDAWIGRFTSEGKSIWDDPMQSPGQGIVRALVGVGTDLIAAGTDGYDDAPGQWRSLIRRFDGQGGGLWSASKEEPSKVDYDATAVVLAGDGRLWVVGRELADDAAPARGFVRLYQPDRVFEPVLERRGDDLDGEPRALALGADGRVVVTGVAGAGGERHLFLAGFDGELAPLWRIDEPADEVTSGRGVARTASGDLVVLGQLERLDGRPATTWLRRYITAAP